MAKLIFLTGFMGSGKSYAARKFFGEAHRLDGDHFFSMSHRVLRPEMPESEKNDWDKWPKDWRDEATIRRVFSESLPKADDKIADHCGHVFADGAIFVYDWFRQPLIPVLRGLRPFEETVHLLYLSLTPQKLFENIHHRGKIEQKQQYDTVEKVARGNKGYREKFGKSLKLWEEFTDYDAFEARIRNILLS
jgi:hypothetical protein